MGIAIALTFSSPTYSCPEELTGWDIAEALRATRDDLPVIYTSGNAIDRTRQVPESLFFDKPCEPAVVVGASAKLLEAA